MTVALFLLVLFTEGCEAAGQLLLKHAMTLSSGGRAAFVRVLSAAIACKATTFFLWLGLLRLFDLSFLYPFDSLNRPLVVFGASFFLKERVTPALWVGVVLITVGVVLVSST